MKHHVAVKFIAILLCALSLLGAAGSGVGILVLTEMDLYNRTVDQAIEERIFQDSQFYAQDLAMNYASVNLGGCPEALVNHYYLNHWNWGIYTPGDYGYALLDEEGNFLSGMNQGLKETSKTYTIPVSGEYMQMVSQAPVQQESLQQATAPPDMGTGPLGGELGFYDNIPSDGVVQIYGITVGQGDGGSGFASINSLGYLFHDGTGRVMFQATELSVNSLEVEGEITYIAFRDVNGDTVYEAAGETAVGHFFRGESGYMTFYSGMEAAPAVDTSESLAYVDFFSLEDPESVDLQVAGIAEIEEMAYDENGLLTVSLKLGMNCTSSTGWLPAQASVGGISLCNTQGEKILDYRVPGALTYDGEYLRYQAGSHAVAVPAALDELEETAEGAEETVEIAIMEVPQLEEAAETNVPESACLTASYYDEATGQTMMVQYRNVPMPNYTVELYVTEGSMRYEAVYTLLRILRSFRNDLFLILGACLLGFAVFAVYLCCAAGHKPGTAEIRAGSLSRTPLDLNLTLTVCWIAALLALGIYSWNNLRKLSLETGGAVLFGLSFLVSLSIVGFFYAAVAQFKTPGGYWWRNSICGRVLRGSIRGMIRLTKWLTGTFFPWLGKAGKALWKFGSKTVLAVWQICAGILKKTAAWIGGLIRRFAGLLPLTWQWLMGGLLLLFLGMLAFANRNDGWGNLWAAAGLGLTLYFSHCFGILLAGVKRMSRGDLDTKVNDKKMIGCFREFAGDLNALADVAVVAAQKQLKSERMKTELITNVSHDIKTPLTSIINYVDLLQKPHTEADEKAYLEVLQRQSLRLKKLIEDLMEMSKASTGNMSVELAELDAVEFVNQALGEFGDKLDRAQLVPVFRHTEASAMMRADGRLVWRVLSNILGNAVKYAMPGTRLYIDLMHLEGKVVISLKNISRDELNLEADELMERFVRGDGSRNTEGSGLGLNIAKSLMELQKGQLQLLVDGDLFKVTLIFPGV